MPLAARNKLGIPICFSELYHSSATLMSCRGTGLSGIRKAQSKQTGLL
jgi:hypothetical protein